MTFDEVDDQLTLPRYNALQRFWMKHPPTPILMAGYVGYKPPGERSPTPTLKQDETDDIAELDDDSAQALFGMFGMPIRGNRNG